MAISVNNRPQGFDFNSLIPGEGPKFNRLQGTGQVDQNVLRMIQGFDPVNSNPFFDAYRQGFTLTPQDTFGQIVAGGGATAGGDTGGITSGWADMGSSYRPQDYLAGRSTNFGDGPQSRFDDGMEMVNWYDSKGTNKYTDVINDPANLGKFTAGDLMTIVGGLGAMGGLAMLPGGALSGAFGSGAGAAGGGAGAVAEGGGSLLGGTLEPLGGSVFEVGLGNTAAGVGSGFGGATGALAPGMGGISALPFGSTLGTEAGLEALLGGLGGAPGLGSGIGSSVTNSMGNAGSGGSGGAGGSGGSTASSKLGTINIPGLGEIGLSDALKWGSVLLGGLAGSKGQKQSQTMTRELPDYLKGPVTGKNGLLSSADRLMQSQLYGTPMGLLK